MSITISDSNISNNGVGIKVEGDLDLVISRTSLNRNNVAIDASLVDAKDFDKEAIQLLNELKDALNQKNANTAKKVLAAIADKSVDLLIALAAGKLMH